VTRLSIEIVPLSSFATEHRAAVRQLTVIDSGAFSATTLQIDLGKRVIVHNDSHDPYRQRSNLSHELSHVLLGHPFTYPIDASGCRNHDRDLEDEASWLGATILVSSPSDKVLVAGRRFEFSPPDKREGWRRMGNDKCASYQE
jgi:hypothetical protein